MEITDRQSGRDAVSEPWFVASSKMAKLAAHASSTGHAIYEAVALLKEQGPLSVSVLVVSDGRIQNIHVDGFSPRVVDALKHRFEQGYRLTEPVLHALDKDVDPAIVSELLDDGIDCYCAWPLIAGGRYVGEVYIGAPLLVETSTLPPPEFMETLAGALGLIIDRNMRCSDSVDKLAAYEWHGCLLESITQGTEHSVMVTDTLGRISLLNPAGERLLGVEESKSIGMRLGDVESGFGAIDTSEEAFELSKDRIVFGLGKGRKARIEGNRVSSFEHGGSKYLVWHLRYAEKTETTVSEQESRLSAFINNDRLAVFYCDQDGVISSLNLTLLRFLGAELETITEGTSIDQSEELVSSGIAAKVKQCLASGEAVVSSHDFFHPVRGSLHLTAHFSPIMPADGNRIGVQAIIEDTTEYVRTRTSLMQSEERYRVFFRNAPISLMEVDFSGIANKVLSAHVDAPWNRSTSEKTAQGRAVTASFPFVITAVNPAAVSMYGAASSAVLIEAWGAGLNWIAGSDLNRMVNAFIKGEPTYRYDTVHKTLLGETIHVSISAAIAPGYESELSKVLLSIQDITRIKKMEKTLKRQLVLERLVSTISARFLSLQPERTGEGISLVVTEAGKTLEADNVSVFELNGDALDATHVWSREGYQFISDGVSAFVKSRFPLFSARLNKLETVSISCSSGTATSASEREFAETTGLCSLLMIPLVAQEKIKGLIAFASKERPKQWVTESVALLRVLSDMVANALDREKREMRRRRSEDLLRTVFHSMAGGLIVVDPGGRVLLANPSAAKNLRLDWPTRIIGKKIGKVARGAEGMLHNSTPGAQQQIVLTLNDGIKRTFGFTSASASSGQRIIVFRDLTKMLEADKRQKRAEELAKLGMVVAKLSHELKNPIASILLGLRGLEDNCSLDEENSYILTSVLEEVRFLKTVVGDFLNATRFQEASPRLCAPSSIFETVFDSQNRMAKRDRVDLVFRPGVSDKAAYLDRNAMIRALSNLVKNGIEACEPGQRVTLGWEDLPREDREKRFPGYLGEVLCMFVEDTGPGMPKEVMENLFIPFTTTKSRGNGLGLSLVRETVAGHGGVIEVITPVREDGRGTRFEILIAGSGRLSCLEYHGSCNECGVCPMPEGCPVRENDCYHTCWVQKGKASLKETGRWNDECTGCPVFLRGNLEYFYLRPSRRKEEM